MLDDLLTLFRRLRQDKNEAFHRVLPFGDYFVDRWEKAKYLGFGEGTSIYDNVVVIGDVKVGRNTWIGPNVVLDGSGGLEIGSNCSISAGVQIYTHDTVQWAITGGVAPYQYAATAVEDNCYIGPNAIIEKGVRIGRGSIVGANSFVRQNVPASAKAYGNPAKVVTVEQQ